MSLHFDELFRKKLQKLPDFVKKDEKSSIWPRLWIFSNKLPCLCISMNFSGKSCKKWLISWRKTKNHRFGQNWQLFEKTTMSWHFHELFRKKLQKVPHFVKKHEKKSMSPKLATFRKNYHVFTFRWTLWRKVAKTASFREKARKLIDLAKTMQLFPTNYHVLVFRWTFEQRVPKSSSIPEKARKIIHLAKTLQLFKQTTMSLHFDEVFRKKLQKVPHFVKKHEKSSIWPKLCNFFQRTTMFWFFDELLSKGFQKVPQFLKKHEKSSIWPKLCNFSNKLPCLCISMKFSGKSCKKCLISWKSTKNHRFGQNFATFRTNYHVFPFRSSFQEKVGKSASFREKARKTIDLAKTFNFSSKLPCLGIFMNFSARSCKKCLIPWKSARNHRFGQNYATFSNKLPCLCISINFSGKSCKRCLISWNSTKNHWFGQSFATFGTSYNVFFLLMNFQEKSCKKCVVSWKSTKNHRCCQLATFRENYHVLTFRWTLQQKVAKSCSCREKGQKIINLAKSLQLFQQTSMFLHFDEFSRKKLPKVPWKSTKNHRFGQNFATFRANYHVLAFRWSFQQKVTKSASFREKARKIVDLAKTRNFSNKLPCLTLWWTFQRKVAESASFSDKTLKIIHWAKTCNFFEQSTMFMRFDELFSKRLQKVPRFVKKHETSSIWPKLGTFRTNYHVLAFRWTFQEKNAKSGPFREKPRTLIDLAKT